MGQGLGYTNSQKTTGYLNATEPINHYIDKIILNLYFVDPSFNEAAILL